MSGSRNPFAAPCIERAPSTMRNTFSFGFGLFALLLAAPASAHLDLLSPPARLKGQDGNTQLKTKPCGQTTNKRTTDRVTTFSPGEQVEIKIKEYINHPGYFAVAFDPDGDDSFVFPRPNADAVVAAADDPKALFPVDGVSVLGIRTDKDQDCYTENQSTHECSIMITIPNVPCENCTLQVTQFMYDKLGNDRDDEYYYQCADIKIEGSPSGGSGGAAGSASGGPGGAGGGGAAGGAPITGGASGGGSGGANSGAGTSSGGTPVTPTAGTSSGAAPSATGGSASAGSGPSPTPTGAASTDEGGCGISHSATGTSGAASLLYPAIFAFALRSRRRRAA